MPILFYEANRTPFRSPPITISLNQQPELRSDLLAKRGDDGANGPSGGRGKQRPSSISWETGAQLGWSFEYSNKQWEVMRMASHVVADEAGVCHGNESCEVRDERDEQE